MEIKLDVILRCAKCSHDLKFRDLAPFDPMTLLFEVSACDNCGSETAIMSYKYPVEKSDEKSGK